MSGFLLDAYPSGGTIYVLFNTFGASGESITMSGLATTDIEIYKNGSTTQRSSDNGYALLDTDGTDFDGLTGIQGISIDLSDNSDASFYTIGAQFTVVISTITVNAQTVSFVVGSFRIMAAESTSGTPKADVSMFGGTAGTFSSGRPEVNTSHIAGSAVSTSSAQIGVNVVNAGGTAWASGSLTSGVFASGAITATAIAADAIGASELAADAVTEMRSLASGTSDSGSTTTMVDAARTEGDTDYWAGQTIVFTSGTISGQARLITGFNAATDTITFAPATTQTVGTQTYEIWPSGRVDLGLIAGAAISTSTAQLGVNAVQAGGTAWGSGAITAASIASDAITDAKVASDVTIASVTGAVGSVTGAVGSVTGNVSGNVTGSVGSVATGGIASTSFASGAITAAAIAADAIGASELASDAVAEIATAVNAEVVDALATDTYAEPGQGNPGATISLAAKIGYLYKAWRNRHTQTASEYALYADDATTKDQEAVVSDNGTTFERGEVSTGA